MDGIELDPWRVIRSFLAKLRSYDVPDVLDLAGLSVDWALTERQDYSHAMRWAAYRPRIDAAYENLGSDGERLRVAFVVARELANRGFQDELREALRVVGWELRGNTLTPVGEQLREVFFPQQSQHDAYVKIRELLHRATTSIAIVDPYVDESILTLLSACTTAGMTVRILTSKAPPDLHVEVAKWRHQHPGVVLEVRTATAFHDRFIVLDGGECWHLGASIKDAGARAFMISQLEDQRNCTALVAQQASAWDAASVLA